MELTRQTKEQIKMLVECGISKTSVASEYNLSMDELEEILNPKPKKAEPKKAKMSRSEYGEFMRQKNRQKGIDTYNRLKPLINNWDGTAKEFAVEYDTSIATYFKVKHADTVNEYLGASHGKTKPAKESKPAKENNQDRRDARKETYENTKPTISPELVELRSISDSLVRIAEALEKKRKWFRR